MKETFYAFKNVIMKSMKPSYIGLRTFCNRYRPKNLKIGIEIEIFAYLSHGSL